MLKLTAGVLLLALVGWIYPAPKTAAQTNAQQPSTTTHQELSPAVLGSAKVVSTPGPIESRPLISPLQIRRDHPTKAATQIEVWKLQSFLASSPLAPYSSEILASRYWSTIIGICWIEQYSCTRAPFNNYWGIMRPGGRLQRFAGMDEAIAAISSLLAKYEASGRDTVESLNCYYVQPCSESWLDTVIRVKTQLENL